VGLDAARDCGPEHPVLRTQTFALSLQSVILAFLAVFVAAGSRARNKTANSERAGARGDLTHRSVILISLIFQANNAIYGG